MSGEDDPIQQARARFLQEAAARAAEEAAARAAEEFDREFAVVRQFMERHPDEVAAYVKSKMNGRWAPTPDPIISAPPAAATDPSDPIETMNDLIHGYSTDPVSGLQRVRPRTRGNYLNLLRRLGREYGAVNVSSMDADFLLAMFHEWAKSSESVAQAMIGVVRILASYGWQVRKSRACRELKLTIHEMRFPSHAATSKRRAMTREETGRFITKAHEMGWHSLAMAQAVQSETGLLQTETIGEWVPLNDSEPSDVFGYGMKWVRGLRWPHFDRANSTLRHTRSRTKKEVEFDLRNAPMVMEELSGLIGLQTDGPVIINEQTGRPFRAERFRAVWREIARAAGVPDEVYNMDSRPEDRERPTTREGRKGQRL